MIWYLNCPFNSLADEIIQQSGNQNVVVKHLDTSDFESVRKFATEINEEEPQIHVLVLSINDGIFVNY